MSRVRLIRVAWRPFAVSFDFPGFHDWQRIYQFLRSLRSDCVGGVIGDRGYHGVFLDGVSSDAKHAHAQSDAIALSLS
jgi:hypothetical protein